MSRLLLVEDEPGLVLTITDLLSAEGYEVVSAADGESGLAQARSGAFDLIILDVMLPRRTGLEVCAELRRAGLDVPILMLTAKTLVPDRVEGLKTGADDYVAKPFDPAELLARLEALLRRAGKGATPRSRTYHFGAIEASFERAEVSRNGKLVPMAARELDLLTYLVEHRDRMITKEELLRNVWKYNADVSSRTIDVHMAWLRQKLEDNPQAPVHLITVRGKGYRFKI